MLLESGARKGARFRNKNINNVYISILLTVTLILAQVILFHIYVGFDFSNSNHKMKSWQANELSNVIKQVSTVLTQLDEVLQLAAKFELDVLLTDSHLIDKLNYISMSTSENKQGSTQYSTRTQQQTQSKVGQENGKQNQEPKLDSIIHLAIVNETSGGQPNIQLFAEALKSELNFLKLQFDEQSGELLAPEVYEVPISKLNAYSSNELLEQRQQNSLISKVYSQFVSHIFVLAKLPTESATKRTANNTSDKRANKLRIESHDSKLNKIPKSHRLLFVVHLFVLYNFDDNFWIQHPLELDEMQKHKLLSFNVHSFDFKIGTDFHYLHEKRDLQSLSLSAFGAKSELKYLNSFIDNKYKALSYENNAFICCKAFNFSIEASRDHHSSENVLLDFILGGNIGSVENRAIAGLDSLQVKTINTNKATSKYMKSLDKTELDQIQGSSIEQQLATAVQFFAAFSQTFGNFSYWLTGASLLDYHKFCSLSTNSNQRNLNTNSSYEFVKLEFGVFESEFGDNAFEGLRDASDIGVVLLTNLTQAAQQFSFQLVSDCPKVVFHVYLHSMHEVPGKGSFFTSPLMTRHKINHRSLKRLKVTRAKVIASSEAHIFPRDYLTLCFTNLKLASSSFLVKVPCFILEYLRRIFVE